MSSKAAHISAIKAAIESRRYGEAIEEAEKVLALDPTHYQAHVYLGYAHDRNGNLEDAEAAYVAATKIKASDQRAWQGLVEVYQKEGSQKLIEYQDVALRLAQIFITLGELRRCCDVLDRFLDFAKIQGSRLQHKKSLEVILPTSPIYQHLEGRVPHPSHTYAVIAQITEFEEKERINKDIGERRTRLGAKIGQVTLGVKQEVYETSVLEELYKEVINWTNDDDTRREYEEKLLRRCFEVMEVLADGKKRESKCVQVMKLASDMVLIKHPYKFAWDIAVEWKDPKFVHGYDPNILREYVAFFPTSGLSKILRGYLTSEISPYPLINTSTLFRQDDHMPGESDYDEEDGGVNLHNHMSSEDRLLLMSEGMADSPQSILAHRMMGEYYQYLDEQETVVELMRNGRRLIFDETRKLGVNLNNSSRHITGLLATALVYYQSPKNHPEAKALFDDLLAEDPTSDTSLVGIGLIYEEEENYDAAFESLGRALERDPTNIRVRIEYSWVKAVVSKYTEGIEDLKACLPRIKTTDPRSKDLLALTQYRIGMYLWNMDSSKQARKARTGAYSYFVAALKSNLNFASAYSILGIFYADYCKDIKRGRKCFQKAFELSSSEVESAERLAKEFAIQGEWESVEVIAQRVVASGKFRPAPGSRKKGVSWPFAALGVSQLNRQDYAKSIVSFQSALRITPNDYHAWVGLGESYHSLGRFIAASRALKHAEQFEQAVQEHQSGETWFAKQMVGNVKRELGEYDEAMEEYRSVLQSRPSEFGVAIALIQTMVESAWDSFDKGLLGQAIQRAVETLESAASVVEIQRDSSNLWKAIGDACAVFSWVHSRVEDFPVMKVANLLKSDRDGTWYALFADVDVVELGALLENKAAHTSKLGKCVHAAILCYKRAVSTSAHDGHAQAVAYYNLGWAEHRAHNCLGLGLKKRQTRYLKTAVRCFKRAIELEARNADFWNSLGVVTSELNPKVAQHAFIRSLYLNERSAAVWTNLGALYLLQGDHQLASEAFSRAQSTDPDFAQAWVGQAFLALLLEDFQEAKLLFIHAMDISDTSSVLVKRQYVQTMFDQVSSASTPLPLTDLVQPLFALRQLQSIIPEDPVHQHLLALFSERIGDVVTAVKSLSEICAKAEADYEVTESPASLSRFALSKADLARLQFSARDYEGAVDSGDIALQLSAEDAGNELSTATRKKCRLSAHITVGLAKCYQCNIKTAIESLQPALQESGNQPDAVCLLIQVLWANGDKLSRSQAQNLLFECVERNPSHVQAALLLGTIALLEGNFEKLAASLSGLQALRTNEDIRKSEQDSMDEVFRAIAIAYRVEAGDDRDILQEIQTSIAIRPQQFDGWRRLVNFTNDHFAAEMALTTAKRAIPPDGDIDADALAEAYTDTGIVADAQRGIMLAPGKGQGWKILSALFEQVKS